MQHNIEDIDFSKLLNQMINDIPDKETSLERECLISLLPLNDTAIKLICGHEFNYVPLFNEIIHQKRATSSYSTVKLKPHQIQCPYCRHIQNFILPYKPYNINEKKIRQVYGVNHPAKWAMLPDKCCYKFKSGKRKNGLCNKPSYGDFCKTHFKHNKECAIDKNESPQEVIYITDKTNGGQANINTLTVVNMKKYAKQYNVKKYYKMNKPELYKILHQIASGKSGE